LFGVLEGIRLVDVKLELHSSEGGAEKPKNANLDANEVIGKVRGFVEGLKVVSVGGQKLAVGVEGFSFSVGQTQGKLYLKVGVDLAFTPKAAAAKRV
jgi:hypothetical protein